MTTTPPSPTSAEANPRLHGNLSPLQLFFSVMAWNAPLVVVVGIIPIMLVVGTGVGTPIVFLCAGLIIAAFAVGFTRMAQVLPNPGAFYAYITAGLGKKIGLGAGLTALLGYLFGYCGTFAFGGVVLGSLVNNTFNGPDVVWYVWALVFWVVAAVLGYLRVDLSAKVLMVCLIAEVAIVVAYDLAVFAQGGEVGLTAAPFAFGHWFDGSFGLGLLFGLGMFGGFELTALYRDEVRDPARTVPRVTFAVIAFSMFFYAATAWLFISALGADDAVAIASTDPTAAIEGSIQQYGGKLMLDIVTVLVTTSTLAVVLAGHNIVTRYVFNLSADEILPKRLSGVHEKHGSPHVASVAASAIALVAIFVPVVLDLEPVATYAAMLGVTTFCMIFAILLTNIAVPLYMRRHGGALYTPFALIVCPILAGIGLVLVLVLAAMNFELLIGGSETLATLLLLLIAACFVGGIGLAASHERNRPDVYAKIGRQ